MRLRKSKGLLVFSLVLLLASTAHAKDGVPDWVARIPEDAQYVYGVGVASKSDEKEARSEAVAMGITSIATAIYSAVSGSYDETLTDKTSAIRDHVSIRTTHSLDGVETVKVFRTGTATYALVRYPRSGVRAARLRYADAQRAAEETVDRVVLDFSAGENPVGRIRSLIHAVNLLAPYGGHKYESAKTALLMAISELRMEAVRRGDLLDVSPLDLPVKLGRRSFTGRLTLTGMERLFGTVVIDTLPFCAAIQDPHLRVQVMEALEQKTARFPTDCVSVSGKLAREMSAILPGLGICVSEHSTVRLSGEYTAQRDSAYSLPVTTFHYALSLFDGPICKNTRQGAVTVVSEESAGLFVLARHLKSIFEDWFL